MTQQARIIAVLTALPGKQTDLADLLAAMRQASRAEPGNLRYDLWRDRNNPERFVLDELYADEQALAAHRESAHFKTYLARIGQLAERAAFVVDPVQVG